MSSALVRLRRPVQPGLDDDQTPWLEALASSAQQTGGGVKAAVELARGLASRVPSPASGRTIERWEVLATLGAADLSVARIAEAHLDALAILAESGAGAADSTAVWGVYAAEGPGMRLDGSLGPDGPQLTGVKPWCSGADVLDRALVTAHVDGGRRLFEIDLRSPRVTMGQESWVARGLSDVRSTSIVLDRTPATPVGEIGWYLTRPGFAWGGMGVAACWFGGLIGVARRVWRAGSSREPDQIAALLLGQIDQQVSASRLALASAAARIDCGEADGEDGVLLAEQVRGTVAAAVESVVSAAAHALGPAPLAVEEEHARRVADLLLYVRQHHAERDTARLGQLLRARSTADSAPW